MQLVFTWLSAICAFVAAYFWWQSARAQPPAPKTYWGETPETDAFLVAFRRSLSQSRWGAIFAAVSALALGVSLIVPSSPA